MKLKIFIFVYMTIIIVIGLPGSGKTTYVNSIYNKNDEYTDDFISNVFKGVLINRIKEMNKNDDIYINDPRLCNKSIFDRYIKIIEEEKHKIKLILFKNNRNKSSKFLSNVYDINNYICLGYEFEII